MAYTTDGTANFNFFINRQGPRGPQGIQGPEGFSPKVEVEEDYGNTFTLRVTNKDTSFVTSNLREHKEDRGGTYVRWDRETEQMYLGDASIPTATDSTAGIIRISDDRDIELKNDTTAITPKQLIENITSVKEELQVSIDANTQLINTCKAQMVDLGSNQTITGDKKFTHLIADSIRSEVQNKVILDTFASSLDVNTNLIVYGSIRNNNGYVLDATRLGDTLVKNAATEKYDVRLATDSLAGIVRPDGTSITVDENGKISATGNVDVATTDKAGIVKPDGNTITIAEDGTISSIAQGDVTAAGDNVFTGMNTFQDYLKIKRTKIDYKGICFIPPKSSVNGALIRQQKDYNGLELREYTSEGKEGPEIGTMNANVVSFQGNVHGGQGRLFGEKNLIAGDNITLTTVNNVTTISSTASGGAEIDDTTAATDKVYSSSKTQELVDNVDNTAARLATELSNALNVITALETRVKALEELIDGGNAGSTYPVELQKFSEKTTEGISINEQINSFSEDVQIDEE